MTALRTSSAPTRVRRSRRAAAEPPRPLSPDYLPSGLVDRREWLASVPRELDDAKVLQALKDVRSDDLGVQSRACATLWRALKPVIMATAVRLERQFSSQTQETIFDVIDGRMTVIVMKARADNLAAFFSYASETLSHTRTLLEREMKAVVPGISLSDAWEGSSGRGAAMEERLSTDMLASPSSTSPDPDQVEALLVEVIAETVAHEHQRDALYHYFGICAYRGRGEKTHVSVGRLHNLSGERVRQLVARVKSALYAKLGVAEDDDDADGDE